MINDKQDNYLSIHVETTGINEDLIGPVNEGHEIVCVAMAVCQKHTYEIIDEMVVFLNVDREDVGTRWHGISKAFLEDQGVDEISAIEEIASFIIAHFNTDHTIVCMGQNVHAFALPFLKDLLYRNEVFIKFAVCALDVFSITVPTIGETTIAELIDIFGEVDDLDPFYQQEEYACLLKAKTFVKMYRRIDSLCQRIA